VPELIRPVVEVLGPRGVGVLSENVGFVFFPEWGVNSLGFIDFPVTQLRESPWGTGVADFFLLLGTFGTLYKLEVDKGFLSVLVSVMLWRCSAKASWIHVTASFKCFSISSACLTSGDGHNALQNGPETCWDDSTSSDELWGTSRCILSLATGLDGQEEISWVENKGLSTEACSRHQLNQRVRNNVF
jgi:hypothetical protein